MSESEVVTLSSVGESAGETKTGDRIEGFALTTKPTVSPSGEIRVYKPEKTVRDLKSKIEGKKFNEQKLKNLISAIKNSEAKVFTFSYRGADNKYKGFLTATSKEEAIDTLLSNLNQGYAQATNPSNPLKIISDVQTELSEGAGEAVGGAGGAGAEAEPTGAEAEPTGAEAEPEVAEALRKMAQEEEPATEQDLKKRIEEIRKIRERGRVAQEKAQQELEKVKRAMESGGAEETKSPDFPELESKEEEALAGVSGPPPAQTRRARARGATAPPEPAEIGAAGPPPPGGAPMPAPAGAPAGEDLSEDQAKKALKQNPEADVNPALIGPDSAEEMKGLIYKDAFSLIFSDRSGVRELEQFKKSDENKEGERKAPVMLYQEAEEIREGYKDQLKIVKLVFSEADEKKYLLQQWQEMHTLKKGAIQNITAGKSANPLNNYDSIGLVVDISSLGISLDDFLQFAERAGLSASSGDDGPTKNTTKLSGFRKPVDLSDIAPKKEDEEQDVKPMSEEKAEEDKKEKSEVIGAPEYITNRPVRGMIVKDGMKVKKHKEKRIKLYL